MELNVFDHHSTENRVAITILYSLSLALFINSNFFGKYAFTYDPGLLVPVLSFLIVAAMAFEWNILGFSQHSNLMLQVLFYFPFTLFLSRLFGQSESLFAGVDPEIPNQESYLGYLNLFSVFSDAIEFITGSLVPVIITLFESLFSSALLLLLFIVLCVIFQLKDLKLKAGFLLVFLIGTMLWVQPTGLYFWAGTLFLLMGVGLQFNPINEKSSLITMLKSLESVDDELEREISIKIGKAAIQNGQLEPSTARSIVKRHCRRQEELTDFSNNDINLITREIIDNLIFEHRILKHERGVSDQHFRPTERILWQGNWAEAVSKWPRLLVLATLTLIYLLSPVDLVPDAVPVVGVVDDVMLSVFASHSILGDFNGD